MVLVCLLTHLSRTITNGWKKCIAGQCVIIPQVHYGAGRHIEYIDPKDFSQAMKLNFISQPIYLFAICFVKISVGFFLLRIAVRPFFRRLITGIMSEWTWPRPKHYLQIFTNLH